MSDFPEPYDSGEISTPIQPRKLDYLAMDYESLKRRAIRFLVEQFPEDYNNYSESDYGILLLELWSFIADHVCYKIDYNANQMFVANTTEMNHMRRLALLNGYQPKPPTAAKAWVSASIDAPQPSDVIIPSGYLTEARGEDGTLSFELFAADPSGNPLPGEDILIPAGSVVNTNIIALEGESRYDTFTSNGNPYQKFQTSSAPVIYGSLQVMVNGTPWNLVRYIPLGPERAFTVGYNSEYLAQISFGDNVYGLIPPPGATIQVSYRIGGGRRGNIVRGAINSSSAFRLGVGEGSVSVTLTNYEAAFGGSDGDTLEDIRRNIPLYTRTQNRLVTGEDYRGYCESFSTVYNGRVGKAAALLRQFGCAANVVDVYILQDDGGQDLVPPTEGLKNELLSSINNIKMISDTVCVKSGEVIRQDISIGVTLQRAYVRNKPGVEQNLRDRLDRFFLLQNWSFGKPLKKGELMRYLSGIPEISALDVVFEANASDLDPDPDVVEAAPYQIIRPGNIRISFSVE